MLVTPVEKLSIAVDDAPFVAVLMTADGTGADMRLSFTTNVGDRVTAGPDHALRFVPDARTGAPEAAHDATQAAEAWPRWAAALADGQTA